MIIALKYESVLDRLNLPNNFGYAILLVSLALLLAPYLRGSDFGLLKVPDFQPKVRRLLVAIGPVAMIGAILIHVQLLPPGLSTQTDALALNEPITINLNIKLDAEVRVKLEEQALIDIENSPEIF